MSNPKQQAGTGKGEKADEGYRGSRFRSSPPSANPQPEIWEFPKIGDPYIVP